MASLPMSRSSTSSSDSEDSDADSAILQSCGAQLQEIRQEDLAAILPDQQECDAFGAFEENEKDSPAADASGSDIELPAQAVNALIQSTTESECESHPPSTLYANSLLQEFVAQTQLLSGNGGTALEVAGSSGLGQNEGSKEEVKRKRGRPKKVAGENKDKLLNVEYAADPNVSPDSGIQNSPDHTSSPESSPRPTKKLEKVKKIKETNSTKLTVTSSRFDRMLYGNTERVLYPPRRKVGRPPQNIKKGPGRPPKQKIKKGFNGEKHNGDKTKTPHLSEICERVSKRLEEKVVVDKKPNRTVLGNKNKIIDKVVKVESIAKDTVGKSESRKIKEISKAEKIDKTTQSAKNRYLTLKNAKLMHSKHKHKKHKKCKFKFLKPVMATHADPKIHADIEKLISDFVKFCSISVHKSAKENVPEMLKALKKASKKRKADYNERKKKKQNAAASVNKETCNEQRLPLKKRHYHLTNNENKDEEKNIKENESRDVKLREVKEREREVKEREAKAREVKMKDVKDVKVKEIKEKDFKVKEREGKERDAKGRETKELKDEKVKEVKSKDVKVKSKDIKSKDVKVKEQGNASQDVLCHPADANETVSAETPITNNNNEYEVKAHIEEAIEACITKYSVIKSEKTSPIEEGSKEMKTTITTPKKRHRLEMMSEINEIKNDIKEEKEKEDIVISEMKRRNLNKIETSKRIEKKKHRLEDLTSSLASKISKREVKSEVKVQAHEVQEFKEMRETKEEIRECRELRESRELREPRELRDTRESREHREIREPRASVIKYPKKLKPIEEKKLNTAVEDKPTGIFLPTVDLELHIPAQEIFKTSNEIKVTSVVAAITTTTIPTNTNSLTSTVEKKIEVKRKVRKRRAINRTGFPTVKKKKKKIVEVIEVPVPVVEVPVICDRVPKEGEECASFVERTERNAISEVIEKIEPYNSPSSKWDVLSECDSLPQDERRAETPDDQSELDELPLEARIAKKHQKKRLKREILERRCSDLTRKRLRDISPASSIDAFTEKRVKEDGVSTSGISTASCASGDEKKKKPPKWRKKYLIAGLFSDYYKDEQRSENVNPNKKLTYKPEEHPYGLLPAPYHCGKYIRSRHSAFELPFDLWWQHTHSQLPGRDLVPSWNYRKIRTNIYNVKNTTGACEPQSCNCSPTSRCGDDCINRLVLAECPASHKCHNQRIQKHEWAPGIEKFMTENKGWGVKTNLAIKNSEFILEYVGEVVSDQEFKERMASRYVHDTHHYCLHLDGGLVIDGHRMGGDGRFVNHSCEPNCEMQKWSVNGQFRMALYALRDIKPGEELTYDYNFSLFNAAEGQECRCGSNICRGVIGGKSQRVRQIVQNPQGPGRVGRPRKNQAKKAPAKAPPAPIQPPPSLSTMKPLSNSQKLFVMQHHCFLLRNLKKKKSVKVVSAVVSAPTPTPTEQTAFVNHLNALRQPRNMRTRRIAQVEENPELKKTARLANLLRDIYNTVTNAKDENDVKLSTPFIVCPSKRKEPVYYQKVTEPIDLTTIEQNIETGVYKTLETFDFDMNKLFSNVLKCYGRSNDLGVSAVRLKKIYTDVKNESLPKFADVLGIKAKCLGGKKKSVDEEDVIRCICGMYRDEGIMIQCERCLVWQHCECVKADEKAPSYHCEKCVPRDVDYEIPMDEFTEHGHQYYMTLLRGDLQLRQGDTVYVLRDIPIPGTDKKHTYDTIGNVKFTDLDIFRIERLWKDSKTGQRFAYGHHYLRPHETYHEPTRKFFPNEVMRVPLYEAVPVELVITHCWVMDLNTFCKGRPMGAPEEHIYICEYRVDKFARLFSKVSKSKFPICSKSYAFERFETRLKISRTYTPHDLDPAVVKQRGRKPQETEDVVKVERVAVQPPVVKTRAQKKTRLNAILLNLLGKMPTKQVVDVSYLLEGGRRRKKQTG